MSGIEGRGWRSHLIEDLEGETSACGDQTRSSARHPKRTASLATRFYVPQYLAWAGLHVIPVPVYDLHLDEILGQKVFRRLADIPGELDLVDVFRRSEDIPSHLDDMLAKRPRVVWFQSGIRNDEVAETLARAGIKVVQDRCLMVEHRSYCGRR